MEPRVFIGASAESQKLVDALIQGLEYNARLVPWYNAFQVGPNGIDGLIEELKRCNFGIFVFAPDDAARMRDSNYLIARDNVVFEAGLFMGLHGKGHTFIITPRNLPSFHLASDFLGITTAKYDPAHAVEDPLNAMAPAVSRLRQALNLAPPPPPSPRPLPPPARRKKLSWKEIVETLHLETRTYSSLNTVSKLTFPLKLHIELTNHGPSRCVIEAIHFAPNGTLRVSPRAKTINGQYKFLFFLGMKKDDPEKEDWNELCTLEQGETAKTWIPIDENTPKTELDKRIATKKVGELRYRVSWSGYAPRYLDYGYDI